MDSSKFLVAEADGVNDFFQETLEGINEKGEVIVSRGLSTKEIRPAMIIVNNPRQRLLTFPGRKIAPFFQEEEAIWILGGRGDVNFISYYLKNMKTFSDGEEEFNAPYGTRIRKTGSHRSEQFPRNVRDQIQDCYFYLSKDSETRHAGISLWNPVFDNVDVQTIDRPCNIFLHFLIRNGKLDLTIFNRSNDYLYGLTNTNIIQFSVILETMAMLLNIPIGKQIHITNSLHIYDHYPSLDTQSLIDEKRKFNVYDYVSFCSFKMNFSSEEKEVRMQELNSELEMFFELEHKIRKGKAIYYDELSFNFLKDGLVLAQSFYHYRQKKYVSAMEELSNLEADDVFVSGTEFLIRKISKKNEDFFKDLVKKRFSNLKEESVEKIWQYIIGH